LNALAERYPVVQEVRGKAIARAGDGKTVKLPLEVSRDGQQMDVLFTVSVGNTQDEQGRLREVQFGYQNAVKNSIAGASRNFAVVRDSARPSTATYLMELRADEIAAGRSEYHSTPAEGQNPDTRLFKDIPIGGQEPLRLSVPVNDRQLPADMSFNLGATPNDLVVSKHGNPNAYALLARQL
jgi:hypothetical protein